MLPSAPTTGASGIFIGTANDEVGSENGGTSPADGRILWSSVRNGIGNGAAIVSFFDARGIAEGSTQVVDSKDNVWNLQGNASIVSHLIILVKVKEPAARRSNIVDYDNEGADRPITGLAIVGEGEGDDQKLFFVQQTLGSIPLYEQKLSLKDTGDDESLIDQGRLVLAEHADVNKQYTLEIDSELEPFKDEIVTGDMCRVIIDDQFVQEDGYFMIGRKRVTLSKQQDEKLTLEVTE